MRKPPFFVFGGERSQSPPFLFDGESFFVNEDAGILERVVRTEYSGYTEPSLMPVFADTVRAKTQNSKIKLTGLWQKRRIPDRLDVSGLALRSLRTCRGFNGIRLSDGQK